MLYIHLLFILTRENSSLLPTTFKEQKYRFVCVVLMDDYFLEKLLCMMEGRCLLVKKLHASEYKNCSLVLKTLFAET